MENIINMDQVPQYFENEINSTISVRGTREIFLKKTTSSHKRFTSTPFINATRQILVTHLLFSNLKKNSSGDANPIDSFSSREHFSGVLFKYSLCNEKCIFNLDVFICSLHSVFKQIKHCGVWVPSFCLTKNGGRNASFYWRNLYLLVFIFF